MNRAEWRVSWVDPISGGTFTAGTVKSIAPKPTTDIAKRLLQVIYESDRPLTKTEWLDSAGVHDQGARRFRSSTGHEAINNFVRNGAVTRLSNGTFRRAA